MNKSCVVYMKRFFIGACAVVFWGAGIVASDAAEMKVGYVNVAEIFDNYKKTQDYDAELTARGRSKEQEFENRVTELNKLRGQLETMNDAARESKTRELEARADELRRFREHTARDLKAERDKMATEVLREIEVAVQNYGQANGFDLLIDGRSVLFGSPQLDVTDAVLSTLNSSYRR